MPPDIFTKIFADKAKWVTARQLINIVLPKELKKVIDDNKAIFEGIQEKPALVGLPSPLGGGTRRHQVWKRTDLSVKTFRTTNKNGPKWTDVCRRVTLDADTHEVIEDNKIQ